MIIAQTIANGLIAGAVYALVAAGFSLIYNTHKFFHLAHGAVYAVGAYGAWAAFAGGAPLPLALLAGVVVAAVAGIAIEFLAYAPVRRKGGGNMALLLASFGALLFFQGLLQLIFGAELRTFELPAEKGIDFFGAAITPLQLLIITSSLAVVALLYALLKKTAFGRRVRAVADNAQLASLAGINAPRVSLIVFVAGSVLAGAAGALVAVEQNAEPAMGFNAVLKGVSAAIVGGVGSVPAAVAGGFVVGFSENVGVMFVPSGYKDAISFALLVAFLLFRPQGLFGTVQRRDVASD